MRRLVRSGLALLWLLGHAGAAHASGMVGDLDGNGAVGSSDALLIFARFGLAEGKPGYDPSADFNDDGLIGGPDVVALLNLFGTMGEPDTSPPGLFVTLNDIPDDMNDLVVVPPEGFQITIDIHSQGGSVIDESSLVVTSSRDIGPHPAGTNLALLPGFQVTSTRAVWTIPAGSDLAPTSHLLTVRVADVAGNVAQQDYGFAVRDFFFGPPLGNLQTLFLDFAQDRSGAGGEDFREDLARYGLASATASPQVETLVRAMAIEGSVAYANRLYGAGGPDPANIVFVSEEPAAPHSRLCVGGSSSQGSAFLGASTLDVHNIDEESDQCIPTPAFGVFPQAIAVLWGADPGFVSAFGPLDPALGGVAFGDGPLDESLVGLVDASYSLDSAATAEQAARWAELQDAMDAFVRIVGLASAHEVGHLLGLTAPGPLPGGLYGGEAGVETEHNVVAAGVGTPGENFVMNFGGSFSFDEITARGGHPEPRFRAVNQAYLRNRIALNDQVKELLEPVELYSVTPSPLLFSAATGPQLSVTFQGAFFTETPLIELLTDGDPTPNPVFDVQVLDPSTATGTINAVFVPAGIYDVRFVNGDGQETTLENGLEVVFVQ